MSKVNNNRWKPRTCNMLTIILKRTFNECVKTANNYDNF